jgi:hypothetical protein
MAEKTEFLPFHAINEYMRPDFRLIVIREALGAQTSLDTRLSNELNHQIKKRVTVPGFRNSEKAPALIKTLPTSKAFEKYPELVAIILSCWAETQPELRNQVYELFKSRHWPIYPENEAGNPSALDLNLIKEWPVFPIHIDRTKLPGFYIHWPKGEDFEALYKDFSEKYPSAEIGIDKMSLMAVWLSMRLPYQVDAELVGQEDQVDAEHSSQDNQVEE